MSESVTPLRRRMVARNPAEDHRVATPLELLFDLCFVAAVYLLTIGPLHSRMADAGVATAATTVVGAVLLVLTALLADLLTISVTVLVMGILMALLLSTGLAIQHGRQSRESIEPVSS
ncbi:hypothetical protein [Saccharopolyspora sp. 5N708]|uniref:hypothetical protein n=1 Tax=Saccharopolyspora sp. 5N708 TaxID=3457424 RepID=UPI003FD1BEBE